MDGRPCQESSDPHLWPSLPRRRHGYWTACPTRSPHMRAKLPTMGEKLGAPLTPPTKPRNLFQDKVASGLLGPNLACTSNSAHGASAAAPGSAAGPPPGECGKEPLQEEFSTFGGSNFGKSKLSQTKSAQVQRSVGKSP